jgi:hypothetical protein
MVSRGGWRNIYPPRVTRIYLQQLPIMRDGLFSIGSAPR